MKFTLSHAAARNRRAAQSPKSFKSAGVSKRPIVITGATSGIGLATAKLLSEREFAVFGTFRKAEDQLMLERAVPGIAPIQMDVIDGKSVESAARRIIEKSGGRLFSLINNAGVNVAGPLEFISPQDLREQFEVNVFGVERCTNVFLPYLRKYCGATGALPRIVNIGSSTGWLSAPFVGAYAGAKFALRALTDARRIELRRSKIPVVLIEPGNVKTPLWTKSMDAAVRRRAEFSRDAEEHYGHAMDQALAAARRYEAKAIPPERVAESVLKALTAQVPKARYVTDFQSRLENFISRLPIGLRDWLIRMDLKI